jgi:arginyl-tRNA synthetase
MNIFENYLAKINKIILENKLFLNLENIDNLNDVNLEVPPEHFDCDLSTNVSLILAKANKIAPNKLAKDIKNLLLKKVNHFEKVEVAGPGFLNIKLSKEGIILNINEIIKNKNTFGSKQTNKTYNVEFVSANPTGPMHVGHCRGAIFGDVLSNLLLFNGNKVIKEYYINDYGNQIKNFVESVYLRIREIKFNEKFTLKDNLYPGDYIKEIAKNIILNNKNLNVKNFDDCFEELKTLSLTESMNLIKNDLEKLGIKHDNFFSETQLVKKDLVQKSIEKLRDKNFVEEGFLEPPKGEQSKNWKKVKRLIFKSSEFGDDMDRALQKNDGSWTYFANDVAYHSDKINRKFDNLINILGADHTGYIKRITAAVSALSNKKVKLNCKVCQLVKLYKNGKPYKMSKRAGEFISAQDLLNEVSKDSIRFMMLNRSNDMELDFDFEKVKEKTKDNPVFYVQYAYARINSIARVIKKNLNDEIHVDNKSFNLNEYEEKIYRKVFEWPKVIESAANKLEPHKIPFYLYELSTLFHSYWSKGNEDTKYKFINNGVLKRFETFVFLYLIAIVIRNGMNILGVSLPEKM